jgi:hypothetical protein
MTWNRTPFHYKSFALHQLMICTNLQLLLKAVVEIYILFSHFPYNIQLNIKITLHYFYVRLDDRVVSSSSESESKTLQCRLHQYYPNILTWCQHQNYSLCVVHEKRMKREKVKRQDIEAAHTFCSHHSVALDYIQMLLYMHISFYSNPGTYSCTLQTCISQDSFWIL